MCENQFNYPRELPISEYREEILTLLKENQALVVCGDTGSGKTTQLPKMAMELGRGQNGRLIACTQPRRLAAVTVAERVAAELKSPVGGTVGYQHRFARRVSAETRVKFMTDGVLLAETRSDPLLTAYDTIIIDEAHERSLNIDFLLGILKRIMPRRKDLKIIVSSATLDIKKFSDFFSAKSITIPGRLFPIEVRYRDDSEEEERNLPREISSAVRSLPPGDDILVFLPGERDIRESADHLKRSPFHTGDDIIPLMASLPSGEQQRAFKPSPKRRIILSTNVAETSVTIPGIRAVIDSGLARISRYVHRTQVQRLQIEPVSQASARQRAGRCGRIGPGTCIRLYSEEDFLSRETYTPPEILRSSLAGVILTMIDLRMGEIDNFPFIDPPKPAMVREGLKELLELGAIRRAPDSADGRAQRGFDLTPIGRKLARIPIQPRLARIMIEASRLAALPSAIPVVAAMSCDDPKRRPTEEKEKADQAHAKFRAQGSDFLGTLKLWRWWDGQCETLSQTHLRKLALKTYLSYPKMREWRDIAQQLTALAKRLGLDTENDNGGEVSLHRALLSGLLARIGHIDPETREYRGAHALRFSIHPSSVLAKEKRAKEWIVAGELVDTSRLFARNAAAIDVSWIEPLALDIVKRSYRSPEWDAENGFARAIEQVTLYGLVIVPARRRDLSRIDPVTSRALFIEHALVRGEFPNPPPAVRQNLSLIGEISRRAQRLRRPELYDPHALERHFESVLPKEIVSARDLVKWLRSASESERDAFRLDKRRWFPKVDVSSSAFPDFIRIGNARLSLSYRHSPDDPERDGITCTVRVKDAPMLKLWNADWLVPGALPEKVAFLLNSLPSSLRRVVAPVSDCVADLLPLLKPDETPLQEALKSLLRARRGVFIPQNAWADIKYPPHLTVRYRIKAEDGRILAETRSLTQALKAAGEKASASSDVADQKKSTDWSFGDIPERTESPAASWTLTHYPALSDEGDGVTLRLFSSPEKAAASHSAGLTRLIFLRLTQHSKPSFSTGRLPFDAALYMKTIGYEPSRAGEDILWAAIRSAAVDALPAVRTKEEFENRIASTKGKIDAAKADITALFTAALTETASVSGHLDAANLPDDIADAIGTQLAWLVFPGFARAVAPERLRQYARYLKGVRIRIDRARANPPTDRKKESRFAPYWERCREAFVSGKIKRREQLDEYRWMIEEYRISVFAPEAKTAVPVSEKRLDALWNKLVLV